MPAPPHPSWWATAAPSPRDLRQAEKLPQSSEGAVQEKQISIKHSARPSPGLPCHVLSSPHPSPGQLLVGRRLRTGGGPLGFPGAGGQRRLGISLPALFSGLFLVLGLVLRDPTLLSSSQRDVCGPMWAPGQAGVEVLWGGGAMPGWRVRGFSTRRTAARGRRGQSPEFWPQAC